MLVRNAFDALQRALLARGVHPGLRYGLAVSFAVLLATVPCKPVVAVVIQPVSVIAPGGAAVGTLSVWSNLDVPTPHGSETNGTPASGDVYATFTARDGMTLADAAAGFGVAGGHFNWLSVVLNGSGPAGMSPEAANTPDDPDRPGLQHVAFPFVDPLPGGNTGFGFAHQPADALPFYWGEGPGDVLPLGQHIRGSSLEFGDHPANAAGVSWDFRTYLCVMPGAAGQTAEKRFQVLGGFQWTFRESDPAGAQEASGLSALVVDSSDTGRINLALAGAGAFSSWSAVVPEPGTAGLLAIVIGLFLSQRCRRR
jgi:hypothetical protein